MPQKHRDSAKFRKWASLYLDSSNSESFGNATESALRVYNAKNRASAANIGYENVRKLENLLPAVTESLGLTLPRLLQELYEKAGTYHELESFMTKIGYLPSSKQLEVNLQQSNQYNFANLAEDFMRARKERGLPVD